MKNAISEKDYVQISKELKRLSDSVTKTVNVSIGTADLKKLKDNNYKMCFAKKVANNDYNVIWQSYDDFSENNTFSWKPEYQIFRTDTFQAQVTVKVSSNPKDIGLGEITTIDNYGTLTNPVTGGSETAINVKNEYKETHIGISQISTGIDGTHISTPIYVSKNQLMLGEASFQPVEKVLVWFESNVETSTMFTNMSSNAHEVNLTQKNTANIAYRDGKWIII